MNDYYKRHYGQLVGKTITNIIEDTTNHLYGFECVDKVQGISVGTPTVVWILCDEEGNGAGHLDIVT